MGIALKCRGRTNIRSDKCRSDICPTVRPRHLSDPRTHRHLSNPRLKMRRLSDLYINRTFVWPQHLSDLTFVRPKAKKWHLSDLDVCPTSMFVRPRRLSDLNVCPTWHLSNHTLKCLSAHLSVRPSVRPSVCPSIRPSVRLPFLLFCIALRQVQIHCQNGDWIHGLEVRDNFSFWMKKKLKKNLTWPAQPNRQALIPRPPLPSPQCLICHSKYRSYKRRVGQMTGQTNGRSDKWHILYIGRTNDAFYV